MINNKKEQKYLYWVLSFILVASLSFVNFWYANRQWLLILNAGMFIAFILIKAIYKHIECLENIRFRIFALPFLFITMIINIIVMSVSSNMFNGPSVKIILVIDMIIIGCEFMISLYVLCSKFDKYSLTRNLSDDLICILLIPLLFIMVCSK